MVTKSVITGARTSRTLLLKFQWAMLVLTLLLAGCGGGGGGGGSTTISTGNITVQAILSLLVNAGVNIDTALAGRLDCPDGTVVQMTIAAGTATGACNGLNPGAANFAIRFTYDNSGTPVILATASKSFTVVAGQQTLTFTVADYQFPDDDSNGVSNLDAILLALSNPNAFLSQLSLICVNTALPSCDTMSLSNGGSQTGFVPGAAVAGFTDYTSLQDELVDAIRVRPTAVNPGATITVNGQMVVSSVAIPLTPGETREIVIVVTVNGLAPLTYRLSVTRSLSDNADLSALTMPGNALSPAFQSNTTAYTRVVAFTIDSVTVVATTAEPAATLTVEGQSTASGEASAPILLDVGVNVIDIIVTAADGVTQKTYTITVTRLGTPNLATLSLAGLTDEPEQVDVSLDPAFVAGNATNSFSSLVANTVVSVVITATAEAPGAVIEINGTQVNNGDASEPIPLPNIGDTDANIITIVVTHSASGTNVPLTRTYTLTIVRLEPSAFRAEAYLKPFNVGQNFQSGTSIAVSGDGNTVAVGAPGEGGSGAVHVYDLVNNIWIEPGLSLQPTVVAAGAGFGHSVALSADGNTLVVGAPGGGLHGENFPDSGAVFVFTRNGQGIWTQQATLLAFNPGEDDLFGHSVALSADGATLAVGAPIESSTPGGIDNSPAAGSHANAAAQGSGAVYVYSFNGTSAQLQAFIKAPNPVFLSVEEHFGWSVALTGNGNSLAVGMPGESSNAAGINRPPGVGNLFGSGAVYMYTRQGAAWSGPSDHIKAQVPRATHNFGLSVALSVDGATLAVGEPKQGSTATGFNHVYDTTDTTNPNVAQFISGADGTNSGAAYIFRRDINNNNAWFQQVFIKASNSRNGISFGSSLALSADSNVLVVGAPNENGTATSIDGNQGNPGQVRPSGAAYTFFYEDGDENGIEEWSQTAYIKAANSRLDIEFGSSIALSENGDLLAVGAPGERSVATGVEMDEESYPTDNGAIGRGSAYLYRATVLPGNGGPP